MSATPPTTPTELLAQLRSRSELAQTLQVVIGQMLLDHEHHIVLDILLGAYVSLVTTCPGCTEQAVRMLPALASQLQSIAAAQGHPVLPAEHPTSTHLH